MYSKFNEMMKYVNPRNEHKSGGCWLHNSTNHDITNCYEFQSSNVKDRFETVRSHGICFKCLRGYHSARNCTAGKLCNVRIAGHELCNRSYPLLHPEQVKGTLHSAVSRKALLNISTVSNKNQPVTVLWDPGSDESLISHSMAKKLGLKRKSLDVTMIKVGNMLDHQTSIPLTD